MAFPEGWLRKCALTVSPSITSGDLFGFPMYLVEDDLPSEMLDADGSNAAQADGDDVRFSSDEAGTDLLPSEVIRWQLDNNPANSTVGVFVRVPAVSATESVTIWVWYKNASATAPAPTDPEGRNAVWADHAAAIHLEEEPADSSSIVVDSSGNLTNGEYDSSGWGSGDQVEGPVAKAVAFSGGTIDFGDQGDRSGSITLAAWVKFTDADDDAHRTIIAKGTGAAGNLNFLLGKHSNDRLKFAYNAGTLVELQPGVQGLDSGVYHRVVVVARKGDGEVDFYVDGSLIGTVTDALDYATNSGPLRIGLNGAGAEAMAGELDEIYMIAGEWDQDRVTADFRNQDGVGYVTVGTPQDGDDGDPNTIQLPAARITFTPVAPTILSSNPNPSPGGPAVLALRLRSVGPCPDDFEFEEPEPEPSEDPCPECAAVVGNEGTGSTSGLTSPYEAANASHTGTVAAHTLDAANGVTCAWRLTGTGAANWDVIVYYSESGATIDYGNSSATGGTGPINIPAGGYAVGMRLGGLPAGPSDWLELTPNIFCQVGGGVVGTHQFGEPAFNAGDATGQHPFLTVSFVEPV